MSGANVPYYLRPNKSIDRQLFIELLQKILLYTDISDHTYISFGGPTLEDFKQVHSVFGLRKMVSIEQENWLIPRQKFNLPIRFLKCLNMKCRDFVEDYNIKGNSVIWLDYASPKLRTQLLELQILIPKLIVNDIVKLTVNANPLTLYTFKGEGVEDAEVQNQKRYEELQKRIGDFLPQDVGPDDMTSEKYPGVLSRAIEIAIKGVITTGGDKIFEPLTSFYYNDSQHQMLTLTGIILEKRDRKAFYEWTSLRSWDFHIENWGTPQKINVPVLTAKEKFAIDKWLPSSSSKAISKMLNFSFAKKEKESLEMIANYIRYYRQYPTYHKVLF